MTDDGRAAHWRAGVKSMRERRATYTPERLAYYEQIADACLAFLQPRGDVLDIGAGSGGMRVKLPAATGYVGIDPSPAGDSVLSGRAECLDAVDGLTFDTVLFYSSLQHVEDPAAALNEAHRVLKPGGRLCVQVPVDDANPIFVTVWYTPDEVVELITAAGFDVEEELMVRGRYLCVRAVKA